MTTEALKDNDCVLAIAGGEVIGVSDIAGAAEWFAIHTEVTEVVRMPIAAASMLFESWPGRAAALTLLAQGGDHA